MKRRLWEGQMTRISGSIVTNIRAAQANPDRRGVSTRSGVVPAPVAPSRGILGPSHATHVAFAHMTGQYRHDGFHAVAARGRGQTMMHGFMRTLLVVGFTSLASHMAAAQPSTTPAHTAPQAAPAAAATTPAQADPCATLTQDTSIVRSINKHGNIVEEPTVSTTSRKAMNAAISAVIDQRLKAGGKDLTVIRVRLPETMTMTADPRGQDFILNPSEKSEAGPNKEITVYYPLTGFELPVEVRKVNTSTGPVDYFGDSNLVRRDMVLKPSTTPGEGLQLGMHMKSVSRADLSDNDKLRKFFRCEENGRVCGFSAVDTVPVQQCSRKEGSGVLGNSSYMVTSNLADFANFVQTSMPKHFDFAGTRSTVGLDHAIWGSAAKAIAVETLMQQDPNLSAAAAKKWVDERFVGYVLQPAIPEEPLIAAGINLDSSELAFREKMSVFIEASPGSSKISTPPRQNMFLILR